MRIVFVTFILFAGCSQPLEMQETKPLFQGEPEPEPLEPMRFAGSLSGAGCNGACPTHLVTINETAGVTVTLTWGLEVNDLDLIVRLNDGTTYSSVDLPPGSMEVIGLTAEAGTHAIEVRPFASGPEEYIVDVTFS